MSKRIGFVLASLHEGVSSKVWRMALEYVDLSTTSLFLFPSGRIDFKENDEYLRNNILSLTNKNNIDGLICWTSSLIGEKPAKEICDKLKNLDLKLVSIGLSVDGIPSISFDAYFGMYKQVEHFITTHRARRIAFLRGPETHKSAEDRFSGYKDCLEKYKIPYISELVSSPTSWANGKEALIELVVERGLTPGIDFDTLICASDYMLSGAMKYLREINVEIPSTLRVAGFNDDERNKSLEISLTTIRMPVREMTLKALELINEGDDDEINIQLPSELIIRRSCGCKDSFGGRDKALERLSSKEAFISWLVDLNHNIQSRRDVEALIDSAIYANSNMKERSLNSFRTKVNRFLKLFFQNDGDMEKAIEIYYWFLNLFPFNDEFKAFCKDSFLNGVLLIYSQITNERFYKNEAMNNAVNLLKNDLLSTRSLSNLGQKLSNHFYKLNIRQAYLVLISEKEGVSKLVFGFDTQKHTISECEFDSSLLLPDELKDKIATGAFAILPLSYDQQYLGYLLLDITEQRNEQLLEDIRAAISSTLKGISLLEEANRAKAAAERAELSSNTFLDTISEGLKEPLSSIKEATRELDEKNRREISFHLRKAEHLLDLSYTERGDVELSKSLLSSTFFITLASRLGFEFDIPNELPLIYADAEKVTLVCEILYQAAIDSKCERVMMDASIKPNGLTFSFSSPNWNPVDDRLDNSLLLAEKIVILHSGSFHFKEHGINITYPWPTLSGQIVNTSLFGYTMFIKKSEESETPTVISRLPQVLVVTEEELEKEFVISDSITRLAWDQGEKREKGSVVLNLLKNHQRSKNLPFLCFNSDSSALDLSTLLEVDGREQGDNTIVILGEIPQGLNTLSSFGSFINISNEREIFEKRYNPCLIILNSTNKEFLETIRGDTVYSKLPILIVKEHFNEREIEEISFFPNILLCNSCICDSEEFLSRLIGILGGNNFLSPPTSAIVKKTIGFLNAKAKGKIARWQLAEYANISEDYLTRIFRKEIGLTPWNYLIRYRVQLAIEGLRDQNSTMSEVATALGFHDKAYFCRVFRKVKGFSPGQIRRVEY